jgi:polyphosphate kinase
MRFIERETANAKAGKAARVMAKMNALVDREVIEALYRASQAGVKIDLDYPRNLLPPPRNQRRERKHHRAINRRRFLEHSRVIYFENGGDPQVFVGSADWMPRNFFRRIETVFPIEDPALRRRVVEQILNSQLTDNAKASVLDSDGKYVRVVRAKGEAPRNSQDDFMALAMGEAKRRRQQRVQREELPQLEVVKKPK